jgi:hypothetical protein
MNNSPSFLCGIGLHWRCTGTRYPVGLPTRPCGCELCHHKTAVVAGPLPPRRAARNSGGGPNR